MGDDVIFFSRPSQVVHPKGGDFFILVCYFFWKYAPS